jgi:glycosyltransferase involved in cell wall biosynthesis
MVSWLICSNHSGEQLRLAIESCLNQDFQDFELIFVANGPLALNIAGFVEDWFGRDERVRIFTTSMTQLPFSLSLGLHFARGSLVARMDSDDISYPSRLTYQVNYLMNNLEVDVLGTNFEIIDDNGSVIKTIEMPQTNNLIRRKIFFRNPLCHPSVMFRRQIVLDNGGYLGNIYGEDYDLWVKLALNSEIVFANLPNICLGYRSIGIGQARRSNKAYASMAGSQIRAFLITWDVRWFLAVILTICKIIIRARVDSK